MMENKNREQIMVSIQCLVYNHERFLRNCLDGFVMQKTNFKYEAIIHDDASTDNSAAIIKEYAEKYPNIIKPIIETENVWSKHKESLINIMDKATRGKYIAYCEGDDYWCDPYKLQKQVDALEANSEATFSYTGFNVVDENNNKITHSRSESFMRHSHSGWIFWDILVHCNFIMTLTTMCRRSACLCDWNKPFDTGRFLSATRQGSAIYIEDRTSCYRINPLSVMNTCPQILKKPYFETVLFEIKNVIEYEKTTAKAILNNPWKNIVVGYILARYIKKSYLKWNFFKLLIKHPSLYIYFIYGLFIRLFSDKNFRKEINKL